MKLPKKKNLYTLIISLLAWPAAVRAQQAGFSYTAEPLSQCAPVKVAFQNTSTGSPLNYLWEFGDGRTSTETNPVITFTTPGPVSVKLTAYYTLATATATRNFDIYPVPAAAFSVDKQRGCGPYTATFTDNTPGGHHRTWDFGDGSAPVTTTDAVVQHQYTRVDTFDVKLTVVNATGCASTLAKTGYIMIAAPVITLNTAPLEGCIPFTANMDVTVTSSNNDPVTQYAWIFGDGQSASSPTPDVSHVYTAAGAYNVSLSVTTQQGCTVLKNFPQLVKAGVAPQNVSFSVTRPDNCAGTSARLLASATGANHYRWDFGDGTSHEGPENDVNHTFRTAGNVTIQLSAGSNGCYTLAAPVSISSTGPVASFNFLRRCDSKNTFNFTNTSPGSPTDTYEWYFDDNSPADNSAHPTHTFSQPGTYNVRLTVRNAAQNCMSSIYRTIQVFSADFHTGVGTICRSSEVPYGVVHVPHTLVESFDWRFGDGTTLVTTDVDIRRKVEVTGTFSDMLIIHYKDPAYCNDTIIKTDHLQVIAPQADFVPAANPCEGQPVTFTQMSLPSPNIPISTWRWALGNGSQSAQSVPAATTYNASGNYTVKLVVTDARNCMDSISRQITVNPTPFMNAVAAQSKICEGAGVNLSGVSNGTVQWQPAYQLSCTNCASTTATPLTDTVYKAIATNNFGCTTQDTVHIKVVPTVNLLMSPDTAICQGASAQLRAAGATFYNWAPNTISGANTAMPIVTPETSTTYTVTAGHDVACPSATAQVTVTVKPAPSVNAGPDQVVTVGSVVYLTASFSNDVVSGEWKPNTNIDCATCPQTVATPRIATDYAFEVTNNQGCKKTDVMNVKLLCDQGVVFFPNGFSPNGDGMNEIFYPRGKGIRIIHSLRIYSRTGQEVFRRENFNIDDMSQGWNGTMNGRPLSPDVYIWLFDGLCDSGERFELKGNVTLLR